MSNVVQFVVDYYTDRMVNILNKDIADIDTRRHADSVGIVQNGYYGGRFAEVFADDSYETLFISLNIHGYTELRPDTRVKIEQFFKDNKFTEVKSANENWRRYKCEKSIANICKDIIDKSPEQLVELL